MFDNLTAETMNDQGAEMLCKAIFHAAVKDYTVLTALDKVERSPGMTAERLAGIYKSQLKTHGITKASTKNLGSRLYDIDGEKNNILEYLASPLAEYGTSMNRCQVRDKLRRMTKEEALQYLGVLEDDNEEEILC